ncbi:type II and III secretion system protein [Cyanobacterium stanieri LEGE 03274]|uniref:Type II and III secretion system protein n=1 Tax=Cyanobacterium stanieri LEGE 03274 TaxID=1828756 RepID=A0ABR9V6I4_9CHRO|nr:secretin N-terminal domain-containing protein [Cyanobacterium stanieri]MBE9223111.1 type II and III secretion system protein [Cyanobacterium stanieri LEGE 03274]
MSLFSSRQLKFVSSTVAILLGYQSWAIASPHRNNTQGNDLVPLLLAQNNEVLFPNPDVRIDGQPVRPRNIEAVPPFQQRAVAPPIGDISVSNTNLGSQNINLGTDAVVPRLVLRDAPLDEVLKILARAAGLSIMFDYTTLGEQEEQEQRPEDYVPPLKRPITIDLEGERVQDIFNNLLRLHRLEASRDGSTIFVGRNLSFSVNNSISRTLRLNQSNAGTVAAQLALAGATVQEVIEIFFDERNEDGVLIARRFAGREIRPLTADNEQNFRTPLPLRRLNVTADERTNSITLTGTPEQIRVATNLIVQADTRLRQVAVNLRIVDVQLDQGSSFGTSFSFGIDNTGIVQNGGTGVINFGTRDQNVGSEDFRVGPDGNLIPAFDESIIITEGFTRDLAQELTQSLENELESTNNDDLNRTFQDTINRTLGQFGNNTAFSRDQAEDLQRALVNNLARTITESNLSNDTTNITDNISRNVVRTLQGLPIGTPRTGRISPFETDFNPAQPGVAARSIPGRNFNLPQAFLAQIRSSISSGNAKILTDPTLVVQERQTGSVSLVENVVTSVLTEIDPESGVRTVTPVIEPAGLNLTVEVEGIDDNGFINLIVNPEISAPGSPQVFDSGGGASNVITPLLRRSISSGLIRIRDGQTLILSGIIQDAERVQVSKIPILGDLPLIGSLFRSTFTDKTRSEVIVMLTPQILNDSEGYSGMGYQYTPSAETGQILRNRGVNIPGTPF